MPGGWSSRICVRLMHRGALFGAGESQARRSARTTKWLRASDLSGVTSCTSDAVRRNCMGTREEACSAFCLDGHAMRWAAAHFDNCAGTPLTVLAMCFLRYLAGMGMR